MKSQPLLSLITPAYNAGKTLRAAFESVKRQSLGFKNIQYIIADDCSTDGTSELCEGYAAEYENVEHLRLPENSGSDGPPRNAALKLAKAPYLMFLDADDTLCERACETLLSEVTSSGADMASGDVHELLLEGAQGGYIVQFKELPAGSYELQDPSRKLALSLCYNVWSKIYRRETVEKHGISFGSGRGWADLKFLYSFLSVAKSARIVREEVINYTVSASSMSHSRDVRFYTDIARTLAETLKWARGQNAAERLAALLSHMRTADYYSEELLSSGFSSDEIKALLESWRDFFAAAYRDKLYMDTAYAKILARDLSEEGIEKTLFDFEALRELKGQRESEVSAILNSRTFKLAGTLQRLLGKK